MADSVQKAVETQLANIENRTGKSIAELAAILKASGLTKHGEMRSLLMEQFAIGYGDANAVVLRVRSQRDDSAEASDHDDGDVLDGIYTGPKAALRPIHEALIQEINRLGEYEIAPKKGYISLRRKKQFAMIGPATNTRVELGLNMKGVPATERLVEMPPGSMCNYKVKLTNADEIDTEIVAWIQQAFDSAG